MNLRCRILSAVLLVLAPLVSRAEESDAQVAARNVALELAGAFSNDGFKLRDGHWSGPIKQGDQAIIAVNLYAGNEYWFSVGANEGTKKIAVQVYDENGKPVTTEEYAEDDKAAAGYSPTISGQYFVGITPVESTASAFSLVYSYK
ncbi:MAG: hypothetical protein ABI992_11045 [Chthoniobacterales bacterium]